MGLAKNATIFGLAAMAANIRKGTQFLVLYGVPKICSAGVVRRKPVQSTRNRYQTDYLALNAPVSFVMDDKMRKV